MKNKLTKKNILTFQRYIHRWYSDHGRHSLPWRQTTNPYHILVSELMLQQTQVDRVIPKYLAFIATFPTPVALVAAKQAEALKLWQGLGYNRRLLHLKKAAQKLVELGHFPQEMSELQQLPGVGPYTASAIRVFAYNLPELVIETNIRAVVLYHFFPDTTEVSDDDIRAVIYSTQDTQQPQLWYSALMDYGSVLKKLVPNPNRRSNSHTTQTRFQGSHRQVRGEILTLLSLHDSADEQLLKENLQGNPKYVTLALKQLQAEGFILRKGKSFFLK